MGIIFDKENKLLTLHTEHSTYQMQVDPYGFLQHLYYGDRLDTEDMSYLRMNFDRACAGNPDEAYPSRTVSANTMPQEYTGYGVGDYRINSIAVQNGDGSYAADFRYEKHEIRPGKYSIPGLPAAYANGGEAETLVVTLKDPVTDLKAELYYGVFEKKDVITRAVRLINEGEKPLRLLKAASLCVDFPYGNWDSIHFHGKHALEKQMERSPLGHLVKTVGSNRGTSSHQQNPFVILCDHEAGEDHGAAYGFMLVYSGGFKAELERDQFDSVRVVMGLQDDAFCWTLDKGETFFTPEVLMSYAGNGLTPLSHNYHRLIRENICRGKYKNARRPILINNWEATYFDFNEESILKIADEAADLGIEMLVLDDGWFGVRNSDNTGLGDWFVNAEKIPCGLRALAQQVNARGLKFGLWIEPEMVNEESQLYRKHPEWALQVPGRRPVRSRNQLVLDMSRQDVRDYLFDSISKILRENPIAYIKWDMNRSISDMYSVMLQAEHQGEVAHRYILGLYDFMGKLTETFPDILFEGCSGGGARFDAGILYYSPQIWCSDDTDPIHRLNIQYGTSFGYPSSTVGAHVSAAPNHQTGRTTQINTRGVVAMSGTFGYELDPGKLSDEDKQQIRKQISSFKKYYSLIRSGRYYRLTAPHQNYYMAWEFAAEDGSEALMNIVYTDPQPNPTLVHVKWKGLEADALYRVESKSSEEDGSFVHFGNPEEADRYEKRSETYTGRALMQGGYTLPWLLGDYPAIQIHIVKA